MNYERKRKQVSLGKLTTNWSSIEFLKETIMHYEELGAEEYYIDVNRDSEGWFDGTFIEFFGSRDETDDEYNHRIKQEEQWEKEKIEKDKKKEEEEIKRKNEKDMKELEEYLKLKEKFEGKNKFEK